MTSELTIKKPDDWHVHFRDGAMMQAVLPDTAAHFGRALVMPNLVPPVVTKTDAVAYRDRILSSGLITAVKLYPAGATTNSDSGVRDLSKVAGVLERMAAIGLPLCVHGEVTDPEVDIFDREAVFIDKVLDPLRRRTPGLRVIMEHVTTEDGVQYVQSEQQDLAATITTHHLMINCVAHVFEEENALDKLEAFVSLNGANYYGVAVSNETITLKKQSSPVAQNAKLHTKEGEVTVFNPLCDVHCVARN